MWKNPSKITQATHNGIILHLTWLYSKIKLRFDLKEVKAVKKRSWASANINYVANMDGSIQK